MQNTKHLNRRKEPTTPYNSDDDVSSLQIDEEMFSDSDPDEPIFAGGKKRHVHMTRQEKPATQNQIFFPDNTIWVDDSEDEMSSTDSSQDDPLGLTHDNESPGESSEGSLGQPVADGQRHVGSLGQHVGDDHRLVEVPVLHINRSSRSTPVDMSGPHAGGNQEPSGGNMTPVDMSGPHAGGNQEPSGGNKTPVDPSGQQPGGNLTPDVLSGNKRPGQSSGQQPGENMETSGDNTTPVDMSGPHVGDNMEPSGGNKTPVDPSGPHVGDNMEPSGSSGQHKDVYTFRTDEDISRVLSRDFIATYHVWIEELHQLTSNSLMALVPQLISQFVTKKWLVYPHSLLSNFDIYLTEEYNRGNPLTSDWIYNIIHDKLGACLGDLHKLKKTLVKKISYVNFEKDIGCTRRLKNHKVYVSHKYDGCNIQIDLKPLRISTRTQHMVDPGKIQFIKHSDKLLCMMLRFQEDFPQFYSSDLEIHAELLGCARTNNSVSSRSEATAFLNRMDTPQHHTVTYVVFDFKGAKINRLSHAKRLELLRFYNIPVVDHRVIIWGDRYMNYKTWNNNEVLEEPEFDTDGYVVTNIHGDYYFAIKKSSVEFEVTIKRIEWKDSLTPIGHFSPFVYHGKQFSSLSFSNFDKLKKHNILPGSSIMVTVVGNSSLVFLYTSKASTTCSLETLPLPDNTMLQEGCLVSLLNKHEFSMDQFRKVVKYYYPTIGKSKVTHLFQKLPKFTSLTQLQMFLHDEYLKNSNQVARNLCHLFKTKNIHIATFLSFLPPTTLGEKRIRNCLEMCPHIVANILSQHYAKIQLRSFKGFQQKSVNTLDEKIHKFRREDLSLFNVTFRHAPCTLLEEINIADMKVEDLKTEEVMVEDVVVEEFDDI